MMTFYPSSSRPDKATTVKVEAGEEREAVDVTIPERETHVASGVVLGQRDQRPVAGAGITLRSKEPVMPNIPAWYDLSDAPMSVITDEQGRWQFDELPDGAYLIEINPPSVPTANDEESAEAQDVPRNRKPAPPFKPYAPKQQDFRVAGSDLGGLVVELSEGARISGTVMFEDNRELNDYISTQFYITSAGRDGRLNGYSGGYVSDGKFELKGITAGKFFLRFTQYTDEGNQKLYLKALSWRGRDLLREPLEVGEGADIEGVIAVYSTAVATMRVRVLEGDSKKPAPGARVYFVLVDAALRSVTGRRISCETDQTGSCSASGAPGEYAVISMSRQSSALEEAELSARAAVARQRVTLRSGENESFEIIVQEGR
jgi:hypothetical protein